MTAKNITANLPKEDIMDDLTNKEATVDAASVDMDKLAELKAKLEAKKNQSAPKQKEPEQSRAINFGVVGSGQCGCIDGNTNIYTSQYGIKPIKDLFYNKLHSSNFNNIEVTGSNEVCISLQDDNIYTVSIDPETGKLHKAKVLAVWKNRLTSRNTIKTNSNSYLVCSKTHPTLTFRPEARRRAYFRSLSDGNGSLSVSDRIFDTRNEVLDLISEKTYVNNIEITSDIAWLLGVFAGDGSNHRDGNEVSFYIDDPAVRDRILEVSKNIPHTSTTIVDRPGCQKISVFGLTYRLFFEAAFDIKSYKTYGGSGEKTFTIDLPSCVSRACSEVRIAFLAGLIDTDGTIADDWCETSISTCSPMMADKLACLISSVGGRASVRDISPREDRENESMIYKVVIYGKLNHGPLMSYLVNQISHSKRKQRLIRYFENEQKSFANSIVPLSFDELSHWMKMEGKMKNVNHLSTNSDTNLKSWCRGERKLSISTFKKAFAALEQTDQITYVSNIVDKLIEIEQITNNEEENEGYEFFDLSVEKYENYVAGNNGFIFTHNSRIAETFYKLGYDAAVINTAQQDLSYIDLPESNKLLLNYGLGGAAKSLEIGRDAAEAHKEQIAELINNQLSDAQLFVFCTSLGGGSGAGSTETMIDIFANAGKPTIVIAALPMDAEDAQAKHNSLQTLDKLLKEVKSRRIHNLVVVDNAKIEAIYRDVSQMDFFHVANRAIVEPLNVFNCQSARPSPSKGLDPMELSKLLIDGEGLTVYGSFNVHNYEEDTALAEAVINNLNSNLLAGGFDIKQSRYVGFMLCASKKVWSKIPASSINYANAMIADQCGTPVGIFRGIYEIDTNEDCVKAYSMFSGLGLPTNRVEQLTKETKEYMNVVKNKDAQRNLSLNLDLGKDQIVSEAQKVKEKIAQKSSAFGKFLQQNVVDRRK